ncbi:MAG: kinase [Rhodospirillales bacterium]|nr:kinase [Rhodospirillales bacterium]
MIISRTPFRVSLFGGGSDYPLWYRAHGGAVIGFAINKYCYISMRPLPPFFDHKYRIVYSRIENVNAIEEIQHPAVRHVLGNTGMDFGVEIHHDGDLPARSGLGSSSSFTVGLLNAVHAQYGRMSTKAQLAEEAIRIEQDVIRENVGSQDQVWAAYGGLNRVDFRRDGSFGVDPIIMNGERQDRLIKSFMLVFTGLSRQASEIAGKKIANLKNREGHIRSMMGMVDEAAAILGSSSRPLEELGVLLHESWRLKRELTDGITNATIDSIYEAARAAGAVGGKLMGAGGGGFMLFFAAPERQQAIRDALAKLVHVAVDVDRAGSRIVVYEPDGLHKR